MDPYNETFRRLTLTAVSVAAVLVLSWARHAAPAELPTGSGALEAIAPDGKPLGICPLRHTDVRAEIAGFVARVVVTQVFQNPFPHPIEATYTFPLSERAAIDDMTMRTGERVIRGEIKRREEARRIYEAARDQGKVAALLDQERPNIFTQTLANLLPGATVEVRIAYVEPLIYRDGTFELSFPTVVGPRFIPGAPTADAGTGWAPDTTRVPDASRITPPVTPAGTRAGHDIAISVDIDAGVSIVDVTAPLHTIDVDRQTASRAQVRLRRRDEIPNRDFVLRYTVAGDEVKSGALAHRSGEGDGYLSLVLLPPKRVTSATAAPKEMIFVIDRSGSQSGLPLQKAKETMHWILDHMNPDDTFQVVDFGNEAHVLFPRPEPASPEMKRRARAHIDALEANGGTMMAEAVRTVCALPADGNRLRVVVFMTDGYVGNDFEVLELVRSLRRTSRWFVFGTGNGVNRFLLEGIAKAGGGEVDYVLLNDPGETVARRFYERIAAPVLTDVQLEFRGLDVVDTYPHVPGDVWDRRPLVVHARYRRGGEGHIVLRGFRQGRPYRQVLDVTLPEHAEGNVAIVSMWARAHVDDLMWQDIGALQSGRFAEPLRDEIVQTALAHRLLTQFTSFVAVEERVVNEGGQQRRVTVPIEMPEGVRYEGVFGVDPAAEAVSATGAATFMQGLPQGPPVQPSVDGRVEELPDRSSADRAREPEPLDPAVRARLAPELLALVEGRIPSRPVPVTDGRVTVKVALRSTAARVLRRLTRAGLRINLVTAHYVIGSLAIEAVGTVAGLDAVEQVTLP